MTALGLPLHVPFVPVLFSATAVSQPSLCHTSAMSRSYSDQVIDDDEAETCPLCIEEFDISDYNFFPCPCGYQVCNPFARLIAGENVSNLYSPQICQFCYNNIKTTMNGLCPACRRQYDDKNIRWKQLTQEEYVHIAWLCHTHEFEDLPPLAGSSRIRTALPSKRGRKLKLNKKKPPSAKLTLSAGNISLVSVFAKRTSCT